MRRLAPCPERPASVRAGRALALWTVIALASATTARAQETFGGLAGGATATRIVGGGINTDTRWGGTAGIFVGYRNWNYGIGMVELNWIQKGGQAGRIDYLEMPFLIGGSTPSDYGFSGRVFTGLSIAIPIGCSPTSTLVDCSNKHTPEISWPIGAQLGRANGPGRFLGVEVRYFVGLSDVFTTVRGFSNRGWQFRLLTTFPLGGGR